MAYSEYDDFYDEATVRKLPDDVLIKLRSEANAKIIESDADRQQRMAATTVLIRCEAVMILRFIERFGG